VSACIARPASYLKECRSLAGIAVSDIKAALQNTATLLLGISTDSSNAVGLAPVSPCRFECTAVCLLAAQ